MPETVKPRKRPTRGTITSALDILGAVLICAGVACIYWPAGIILAGVACIVVSWGVTR